MIEDGSNRSTLTPINGVMGATVFDGPELVTLPKGAGRLIALPYPSVAGTYDPAAFVAEARLKVQGQRVVVAGHLQVVDAPPGEESEEMGRGRDVPFPFEECEPEWLLLGGHYHVGQSFQRKGRALHVPGSMARLTHGDASGMPRFLIWEV